MSLDHRLAKRFTVLSLPFFLKDALVYKILRMIPSNFVDNLLQFASHLGRVSFEPVMRSPQNKRDSAFFF
jgi:hypothetical protein